MAAAASLKGVVLEITHFYRKIPVNSWHLIDKMHFLLIMCTCDLQARRHEQRLARLGGGAEATTSAADRAKGNGPYAGDGARFARAWQPVFDEARGCYAPLARHMMQRQSDKVRFLLMRRSSRGSDQHASFILLRKLI